VEAAERDPRLQVLDVEAHPAEPRLDLARDLPELDARAKREIEVARDPVPEMETDQCARAEQRPARFHVGELIEDALL